MDDFLSYFEKLPQKVKEIARKNYRLWRQNPYHPGLQFKQIHSVEPIFSVRIGKGWRALGLKEEEVTLHIVRTNIKELSLFRIITEKQKVIK